MSTVWRGAVQYLVLPDETHPYLLARVRWPDVFQAISPARPDWQDDPGLFDLPYDPSSTAVTLDQAIAIAAEWGARLPSDEAAPATAPSLIRRMPADWSNLSPAEMRAWSIEPVKTRKRAAKRAAKRRRRQMVRPSLELIPGLAGTPDVIDLTDTGQDVLANAEDA